MLFVHRLFNKLWWHHWKLKTQYWLHLAVCLWIQYMKAEYQEIKTHSCSPAQLHGLHSPARHPNLKTREMFDKIQSQLYCISITNILKLVDDTDIIENPERMSSYKSKLNRMGVDRVGMWHFYEDTIYYFYSVINKVSGKGFLGDSTWNNESPRDNWI